MQKVNMGYSPRNSRFFQDRDQKSFFFIKLGVSLVFIPISVVLCEQPGFRHVTSGANILFITITVRYYSNYKILL